MSPVSSRYHNVAPFVGAWIEIVFFQRQAKLPSVAPFVGAWIEILSSRASSFFRSGRSLRGSVDWNFTVVRSLSWQMRRSLRGSVDWNYCSKRQYNVYSVAPFVGAWIEIVNRIDIFAICPVAPFVGAWIEIFGEMPFVCFEWKSLPSWERGLKCDKSSQLCLGQLSLPSWERGLKSLNSYFVSNPDRRSLRGSVDWNCMATLSRQTVCTSLPLWKRRLQ